MISTSSFLLLRYGDKWFKRKIALYPICYIYIVNINKMQILVCWDIICSVRFTWLSSGVSFLILGEWLSNSFNRSFSSWDCVSNCCCLWRCWWECNWQRRLVLASTIDERWLSRAVFSTPSSPEKDQLYVNPDRIYVWRYCNATFKVIFKSLPLVIILFPCLIESWGDVVMATDVGSSFIIEVWIPAFLFWWHPTL